MELQEYITIIRRHWRLVLATVLTSIGLAAGATAFATPVYTAQARIFVSTGGSSIADIAQGSSFAQRQMATYADLVTAPVVLDPVAERRLPGTDGRALAQYVSASVPEGTVLIDVTVEHPDPDLAASLANDVASEFSTTVQQLEHAGESGTSPVKATIISSAAIPSTPASPRPYRNVTLGAVLGLALGSGLALLRGTLDTRITNERDVTRLTDATIIGGIAFDRDAARHPLIVQADPHSARAEAFRTLRTNLQFVDAAERPRTILFTSSMPGEGKTTTTANLALTLAASGSSVVVIEGDLRRPRLLQYMGMEGSVGLTNILIGEADDEDVLQPFGDSLTVLGAGTIPPNPSELLGSQAMANLLTRLEERFDYVIIDAPPLLPVTDAAVLAKMADGTIVVVGSKVIRREHLARALQSLDNVGAHVLGLVMNRLPTTGPEAYTYYTDGYRPDTASIPTRKSRKAVEEGRRSGLLSRP